MRQKDFYSQYWTSCLVFASILLLPGAQVFPADNVNMIYTARVMSQAYPWFAQEAGLFKKYDLDVPLVFVTPGAPSVAAILSGDSEVPVIGAASITRPVVQGNKDPVRRHQKLAYPQHHRETGHQTAGAIEGQTHRRFAHRQQPALFRGAGVAPLRHRFARG